MKVELIRAWPQRFERIELDVREGATVDEALGLAGWSEDPEVRAYAIFGQRVESDAVLRSGDRVELLRPLQADPKLARRQRVEERRRTGKK